MLHCRVFFDGVVNGALHSSEIPPSIFTALEERETPFHILLSMLPHELVITCPLLATMLVTMEGARYKKASFGSFF